MHLFFYCSFLCISAATQGSEEGSVEAETRDCSDSTVVVVLSDTEKSDVATGDVDDGDILGVSDDSMSSVHTTVLASLCDRDDHFDPHLPTGFDDISQASPAKDKVVEKETSDGKSEKKLPFEEGKSEKKVPTLVKKDGTESAEVSTPAAIVEIKTSSTSLEESLVILEDDKILRDLVSNL